MAGLTRMNSLIVAVIVVVMTTSLVTEAQTSGQLPSCVTNLMGCADSLNTTTTPPDTCCAPLKEALTNDLPCLCKIYTDPDLLKSFNINLEQSLAIPARCGINFSINACNASPPPSPGPASNVGRIASAGMFSSLIILVAAMFF